MIDHKFRVVFQISQLANIPQKWFSTQNGPLDVRSQMKWTPTIEASDFWKNQAICSKHFKSLHHGFSLIFPKIKSSYSWGSVSFEN